MPHYSCEITALSASHLGILAGQLSLHFPEISYVNGRMLGHVQLWHQNGGAAEEFNYWLANLNPKLVPPLSILHVATLLH